MEGRRDGAPSVDRAQNFSSPRPSRKRKTTVLSFYIRLQPFDVLKALLGSGREDPTIFLVPPADDRTMIPTD